jgi:signal transduction histidine kinase
MNTLPASRLADDRRGHLAFLVLVAATYLMILASNPQSFFLPNGAFLVVAGAAYLLNGIVGFAFFERRGSLPAIALYFAIQILLGTLIVYWSNGVGWLIPIPLAAQSLALPKPGTVLVCALLVAAITVASGGLSDWRWSAMARAGVSYLTAVFFVAAFTHIAVSERQARTQAARLAAELSEANRRLREYAAQIEELATAKERNRLAREIHDGLGHHLSAINIQIEAARAVVDSDRSRALDALAKAQTLAKDGLEEVRRSVAALREVPAQDRPLPEAIAGLAEECRAAGIVTEFNVLGSPRPLQPQTELTLYRVAQEGLTNVRRHAHASCVEVALDYRNGAVVRLTLRDNGVGANDIRGGFGLLGVRERVQLLDGKIEITTELGKGFALQVELPG